MSEELVVAPCSTEAVRFACEHFHYSKTVPGGKIIKHGVWENGKFIGVVVYGDTPNPNFNKPYGLKYTEICELRRVALTEHKHTVTEIVSKSLKLLHKTNPGLELVVSYADSNQEHLGIIYQAGNWIYEGMSGSRKKIIIFGEDVHARTVYDRYGTSSVEYLRKNVDPNVRTEVVKGKFKYLYPLTRRARKRFSHLHKDYPKSID